MRKVAIDIEVTLHMFFKLVPYYRSKAVTRGTVTSYT